MGGLNIYAFVVNNPLMYSDLIGLTVNMPHTSINAMKDFFGKENLSLDLLRGGRVLVSFTENRATDAYAHLKEYLCEHEGADEDFGYRLFTAIGDNNRVKLLETLQGIKPAAKDKYPVSHRFLGPMTPDGKPKFDPTLSGRPAHYAEAINEVLPRTIAGGALVLGGPILIPKAGAVAVSAGKGAKVFNYTRMAEIGRRIMMRPSVEFGMGVVDGYASGTGRPGPAPTYAHAWGQVVGQSAFAIQAAIEERLWRTE